jgi:hypothetical protein
LEGKRHFGIAPMVPTSEGSPPPSPQKFWVKTEKGVFGPFSSQQLRDGANEGVLKPQHQVSNDRKRWVQANDVQGLTFPTLWSAVYTKNLPLVYRLLKNGADANACGYGGETVLHLAVKESSSENLAIVKLLLEHGARTDARQQDLQWTPLHVCAAVNTKGGDIAALLLKHGADPDSPDQYNHTPLFFARDRRNDSVASILESVTKRADAAGDALSCYANELAALVGQPVQWETTGLERAKKRVRALGEDIDKKFGFKGMQQVWHKLYAMKGPQATSDLTRIWDGIGQWQK